MNPILAVARMAPIAPWIPAIGWSLLHLLWQGALVALALAAVLALLPRSRANARYAASCVALVVVLACGVVTAIRSYSPAPAPPIAVGHAHAVFYATTLVPGAPIVAAAPDLRDVTRATDRVLPWLVAFWVAGVGLCSVRLVREWLRVRALARGSSAARAAWTALAARIGRALGVRHAVRLLESAVIEVPSVIGLVRPAILLPVTTLTGLTTAQFEMILAHELAHIRRQDFLVNLLQAVLETLLFYHPAVWWISRQVRLERENCCDDLAIALCGNRLHYARALTRLEELRAESRLVAVSAGGGSLLARIRRIVSAADAAPVSAVRGIAALGLLVGLVAALAMPTLPAIGESVREHELRAVAAPADRDARDARHDATHGGVETGSGMPSTFPAVGTPAPDAPAPLLAALDEDAPGDAPSGEPSEKSSATDSATTTPTSAMDGGATRRNPSDSELDDVIALRSLNVTAAMVRDMRVVFPNATLQELASLAAVGATPDYVRELRAAGLNVTRPPQATSLAAVGVTARGVRALRDAGIAIESTDDATSLAAVGVTPEFVRAMRAAGLAVADARQAQELAGVGVTPGLVRELRDAGLALETAHDAVGLAAVGVTGGYVRELRSLGLGVRTTREVQGLAAVGVTSTYVRELRAAGVKIATAEDAQSLMALGITPELVARLARAGYRNLSVEDLQRLGASGITGDFLEEMSRYRSH